MTNWENEANRIKAQQQFKINSRIEEKRQGSIRRENEIQEEIKSNYENIVLPGFKILDSFNIKETLIEIRDQVWKTGEISSSPNNLNEYNKNIREEVNYWDGRIDHLSSYKEIIDYDPLSLEEKNALKKMGKFAEYNLKTKYLAYTPADFSISGDGDSWHPSYVDLTYSILTIGSDKNFIYIDSLFFDKKILIEENSHTQIKKWLEKELIEDCTHRRDFSKMDPEVISHPDLYKKYLDRQKPQPTQKRSFLDKLFG